MDEDGWTRMVGRGWSRAVSSICSDSIVVWFEWFGLLADQIGAGVEKVDRED